MSCHGGNMSDAEDAESDNGAVNYECCKKKNGTKICVCLLCGLVFHRSCLLRKKTQEIAGIFVLCGCNQELTSKINSLVDSSEFNKSIICTILNLLIQCENNLSNMEKRKEIYKNEVVTLKTKLASTSVNTDFDNNRLKTTNELLKSVADKLQNVNVKPMNKDDNSDIRVKDNEIKRLNELNTRLDELNLEIKSKNALLEKHIQLLEKTNSYAHIASTNSNSKSAATMITKTQIKTKSSEIVIQPTNKEHSTEVLKQVKSNLSKSNIKVDKIIQTGSGKIILSYNDNENNETLEKTLDTLKEATYEKKCLKNPLIKITGIDAKNGINKECCVKKL